MKLDEDAIQHVMNYTGLPRREVIIILREGFNAMSKAMLSNESVVIKSFGTFRAIEKQVVEEERKKKDRKLLYEFLNKKDKEELNELVNNLDNDEYMELFKLELAEYGIQNNYNSKYLYTLLIRSYGISKS